ncbi:hypothetical protein N0V90_001186 [Kalmusia sp. IMI 367209]|nr:hypothetical protein N0V90_001186 [Kalmusia sp. IMI 367209]
MPSPSPSSKKSHTLTTGHTYTYTHTPPSTSIHPTFLLLHGFPTASQTWHALMHYLTAAGYGVLAPDLLGYNGTSKPVNVQEYACSKMSAHIAELLSHEKITRVIGVGHDWGAVLLARMWNYHPSYFASLVFMSVPYQPPAPMDLDAMNKAIKEAFGYEMGGYWYFLTSPEAAKILSEKTESFLSILYQTDPDLWKTSFCPTGALHAWLAAGRTAPLASWLAQSEFDEHVNILKEGGFEGPLNWYNAALQHIDAPAESKILESALTIPFPVTFIVGELDAVGRPEISLHTAEQGRQKGYLPHVEVEVIPEAGHWMMLENPSAVFEILEKAAKGTRESV